ncbi:hypothetical protein B4096_2485 [Heyndrickxia coagulans]|nr:hypothetical protein B4100_2570 [Heyndrickxia coagulans]KYC73899.1 hypothetical protein B4096_2485 [Heyndrickxia coagulans]
MNMPKGQNTRHPNPKCPFKTKHCKDADSLGKNLNARVL